MRICIVGLGAIGGLFAARLARAGYKVSAIARGATLEAVRRDGLALLEGPESEQEHANRFAIDVCADPSLLGEQDVVIVAVKTTGLTDVAQSIAPLLGKHTTVLSAMNGVPWWFFRGLAAPLQEIRMPSVDPNGMVSRAIPAEHVVGCVTHLSATTPAPGTVRCVAGNRLIIGEPGGGVDTARSRAIASALREAGFDVDEADVIQQEIWFKLWGNMTVNPVSALTGATGDRILDDDYVRQFMSRCMLEAAEIGQRIGLPIDQDPDQRHAVTRKLGSFRTSMLQDVEGHRPVELDALVHAVIEISRQVGVTTPNIDAMFGLARLQARVQGLY
jgi:2-dehydropantoate 2-reductase